MNESERNQTENKNPERQAPSLQRRYRRGGTVLFLALVAGLVGFATARTMDANPWGHARHRGSDSFSNFDAAGFGVHGLKGRMGAHLPFVMSWLDVTDEQRSEIRAIVKDTLSDIMPLVGSHRESRHAIATALAGDSVDWAALETIRTEQVSLVDEMSTQIFTALGTAAEVLSAEQRKELRDLVELRHAH